MAGRRSIRLRRTGASALVSIALAVGAVVLPTTPGAATGPWQAPQLIDATTGVSIVAVSCTSPTFCMAVDVNGNFLTYNGLAWTTPSAADAGGVPTAVSCSSSAFCVLVDNSGNAVDYNGSTWTSTDADGTNNLTAVSCTSTSFCEAVDSAGNGVNYDGTGWTQQLGISPGSVQISGVSCVSTSCVAQAYGGSGNHGYRLMYSGGSWSSTGSLGNPVAYGQVTCVSISPSPWCDYIDNAFNIGGVTTYYGPTSGTQLQYNDQLESVSCTSTSFCEAVDEFGAAFNWDGSSWSIPSISVDAGGKPLNSISCTSSTFCMAVDAHGNAFKYNGTWGTARAIDEAGTILNAVSCHGSTFCAAVDANGHSQTFNGTSWSVPAVQDAGNALSSVSCPSSGFCAAVDSSGNALMYNGASWSSPSTIDGTNPLNSVSCPSSGFCAAVDSIGRGLTYNGTAWSSPTNFDAGNSLVSVSCPSSGFCAAVDSSSNAFTYTGSSWSASASPANPVDTVNFLKGVSCTSPSFCLAVDGAGNALTYNGSSWSAPVNIGTSSSLNSVSCTSPTFCVTVGAAGEAAIYSASSWTASDIDGTTVLDSVSCVGRVFCAAVDAKGNVVAYVPASTSVTTSLSGDSQSGTAVSVPVGTAITDQATLSGETAGAGGTVTYTVFSDAACTVSVGSGGTVTVTGGSAPASSPVTLNTAGTYYWQASYSGDVNNGGSLSACGPGGEVETVNQNATSLTTSLSGASLSGPSISVPPGTSVADQATLSGATAGAGGTVTYDVFSDVACTVSVGSGGTVTVTSGSVPVSNPVALDNPGTFYWKASYTGDTNNAPSTSRCGPTGEVESVTTALTITTVSLPPAARGVLYTKALSAAGGKGPYKWKKVGRLPKGLKISGPTGILSGTPSAKLAPGLLTITIEVLDHSKPKETATKVFSLTLS